MEREIILEGILSMLEELKESTNKLHCSEDLKNKLEDVDCKCDSLLSRLPVTPDIISNCCSYVIRKIIESNKKQGEEIKLLKNIFSAHHMFIELEMKKQQESIVDMLHRIENLLEDKNRKISVSKRVEQLFYKLLN